MSESAHKYSLTTRIFIGMFTGIITGILLQALADDSGDLRFSIFSMELSTYGIFVEGIFSTIGTIFVNSLKMLVVPLVFVSLVLGTSSLSDPAKLGRLGIKSVGLYIFTTAVAITLAMTAAFILRLLAGQTKRAKVMSASATVLIGMTVMLARTKVMERGSLTLSIP